MNVYRIKVQEFFKNITLWNVILTSAVGGVVLAIYKSNWKEDSKTPEELEEDLFTGFNLEKRNLTPDQIGELREIFQDHSKYVRTKQYEQLSNNLGASTT